MKARNQAHCKDISFAILADKTINDETESFQEQRFSRRLLKS